MKIDCSITQNFMKEFSRMCKYMPNCRKCDMNLIGEYGSVCYEDCMSILQCERYMTDIQEIVQNWSDEHPQLTYLEDFKNKFPNFQYGDDEIIKHDSNYCVSVLYGSAPKMMTEQGHEYSCNGRCSLCWNQPIQ